MIWENILDQDTALLKLDFSNAFNSVPCQLFLDQSLPGIYSSSFITTISSSEGVQQGDFLGPLLFCLVLHKFIEKVESLNFSIQAYYWCLDDGSIIANPKVLADVIQSDGPALDTN